MLSFFSWWYGRGWREVAESFGARIQSVLDGFSVRLLLPTLFAPWRRIMSDTTGRSLPDRLQAWADTTFSRVVGFVVRLTVLVAALVTILIVGVLTIAELIIWPLLPIAIPVCIVWGLVG